jgi:hypothetical protein
MTNTLSTEEQIAEAIDWASDCLGLPDRADISAENAVKYVRANYPGGWDAFVSECCTFVQLESTPAKRQTVYKTCDGCGNDHPGQLVESDGTIKALCFTCWNPVRSAVKVLDWINKHGKLQFGNSA